MAMRISRLNRKPLFFIAILSLVSLPAFAETLVSSTVENFEYDNYGNLTNKTTQATFNEPIGSRVYTQVELANYSVSTGTTWLPGLMTCALSATQIPAETGLVASDLIKAKSSSTNYYTSADKLDKIQSKRDGYIAYSALPTACEAAPVAQSLLTTYAYDNRGDISSVTVGEGSGARFTTMAVAPDSHRRTLVVTNPVGESNRKTVSPFGQEMSAYDPNGTLMLKSYDLLGRPLQEFIQTTSITSTAYYQDCSIAGDCLTNEVMRVKTDYFAQGSTKNMPSVYRYLDRFGRELRTRTMGYDGRNVITKNSYDAKGNLVQKTLPYLYPLQGTEQIRTITLTYDRLGRLKSSNETGIGTSTITYPNAFDVVTSNVAGQKRTQRQDGAGRMRQVTDNLNLVQKYVYDASGNLRRSIDPVGNVAEIQYNTMGQRTQVQDPDLGVWSYGNYDAFGNVQRQTDNKGAITNYEYDKLDRLTRRQELDLDSHFEYGSVTPNFGKLVKEYTQLANGNIDYQHTFNYDAMSRLSGESYTAAQGEGAMVMSYSYTPENRINTVAYDLMSSRSFFYKNIYDDNGFLKEIQGPSGSSYWKAIKRDANGRLIRAKLGNGLYTERNYDTATSRLSTVVTGALNGVLDTDPITANVQNDSYGFNGQGNLTLRQQNFTHAGVAVSLSESFGYDAGNRVTSSTVLGQSAKTVKYDELGNIAWKSDLGSYQYGLPVHVLDPDFNPASSSGSPTVLSTNPAGSCGGVHRVCKVVNGTATLNTLTYDGNGNLLVDAGHTFQDAYSQNSWMSFNLPYRITRSGGATDTFRYGAQHERVIHETVAPGSGTTTMYSYHPRLDSGATYEYTHNSSNGVGRDEFAYYLYAEGEPIGYAQHIDSTPSGSTDDTRYFHTDHLGSITAVSNNAGQVVARYSYDIWGKRRNLDGSDDVAGALTGQGLLRGYTGHEMLDKQSYIHMNGRIYDPQLARFISADPTIDGAGSVQGFNRYAYVHNNPGTLVDPSGFSSSGFYIETKLNYSFVSIGVTSHQDGSSVGAIVNTQVGVSPALYGNANNSNSTVVAFSSPVPFTANSEFVRATVQIGQYFQLQAEYRWFIFWMSQVAMPGNCWTNTCGSSGEEDAYPCTGGLDCYYGRGGSYDPGNTIMSPMQHISMGFQGLMQEWVRAYEAAFDFFSPDMLSVQQSFSNGTVAVQFDRFGQQYTSVGYTKSGYTPSIMLIWYLDLSTTMNADALRGAAEGLGGNAGVCDFVCVSFGISKSDRPPYFSSPTFSLGLGAPGVTLDGGETFPYR